MSRFRTQARSTIRDTLWTGLVATATAGILVGAAGCGNASTTDAATAAILQADTLAVTRAAASHDAAAARTALARLSQDIGTAAAAGHISTATVNRLRSDVAAIRADLRTTAGGAPSTLPSTGPASTTAPPKSTSTGTKHEHHHRGHRAKEGQGGD
jgi:hypothetical protein